ncbi:MAG: transcription termination factor Rho [Planctomycetes bacterium]|nr:transcription termination factor Rho [Planctomycetota bacterium]
MTESGNSAVSGVLELQERGYGFLRHPERDFRPTGNDIFVPPGLVARYRLKTGVSLEGATRPDKKGRGLQLGEIQRICGEDPDVYKTLKPFENLTVIDPEETLWLETGPEPVTTRVLDLLTPIGKGQRGLIVSPPRAGKTIMLEQMAVAVHTNYPDVRLMMVLVDERPEEVTHFRRATGAEVLASSNDQEVRQHVRLSRLAFAQAKVEVEFGRDVVLFLDSLTRLGRAFNKAVPSSGRTMSGGVDIHALVEPKRMFGAARNIEHGGSLTVIATCLIETGSRMDDLIFQEFKGTGNMEVVLSQELAERRLWPAMDVLASGTRKEERLVPPADLQKRYLIRRRLAGGRPIEALETLLGAMKKYPSNRELLDAMTPREE